ncbi:MAG: hypothetical protein KKD63_06355, partial [Proteobacteria bacterium]|nr:hypothetical protein [Pseudomonadota bacterium]
KVSRPFFCLIWQTPSQKLFSIYSSRACPTNGSDCGSLRSHNLTLFVGPGESVHRIIDPFSEKIFMNDSN